MATTEAVARLEGGEARLEIEFERSKDTKNTIVYDEVGMITTIRTMYLQKQTWEALGRPDRLAVIVEPA